MTSNHQIVPAGTGFRSSQQKESDLRSLMRSFGNVLVAYSGGVDSAYLAAIANEELGSNAVCVLGLSPSVSQFQRETAASVAAAIGLNLETIATHEMDVPGYRANAADRCYYCKDELYSRLGALAADRGIAHVLDGTNHDDLSDHRPGRRAAAGHRVRSPLAEVGLTKVEIRELSRGLGLETWDKPASPCLSSRVAPGTPVTIGKLGKIERGEETIREFGFSEFRLRVHGEVARLEIARGEMKRVFDDDILSSLTERLKDLGFRFVTLDLEGFRSGSMNPEQENR